MKFKILMDSNANDLECDVNKHLAKGWILHGSLQVNTYPKKIVSSNGYHSERGEHVSNETVYVQAVTRTKH